MNAWYTSVIQALFDSADTVCVAVFGNGAPKHFFNARDLFLTERAFDYFQEQNQTESIYVAMNTFKDELRGAEKGRTEENVAKIKRLYADADDNGIEAFNKLTNSATLPQPHVVMETSPGKFQFIWNVDGLDQHAAKRMLKAIAAELGTDPAVAETARVFRLPGFVNRKKKYTGEPIVKLVGDILNRAPYSPEDFKLSLNTAPADAGNVTSEPFDLDQPFIHGQLDNQICSFIGHYISADNVKNPETLYTLITAKMRDNTFERDGVTPYQWNDARVRELCQLKTKNWKTGEEQRHEATVEALAEAAKVGEAAAHAQTLPQVQPSTLIMSTAIQVEEPEIVEVFDPKTAESWHAADMSCMVMTGRLGEICDERMLAYFPVAYAWPALIAVAGAMVPQVLQEGGMIQPSNMVNSYTGLVGPVHSGKSQAIHWATRIVGIPDTNYTDLKAGSSEGLLSKLAALKNKGAIKDSVLIDLDEWAHFFSKAGIENSSFTSFLHTAFYKRKQSIIAGRGRDVEVNCALSFIGGIVEDDFDTCFGASSLGGLHDRFTFGLCPEGFNFMYRPFEGRPEVFEPVSVLIAPEIFELTESIRKDSTNSIGREAEIAVRAAQVCASFDGVRILDAKYGERMIRAMIAEQSKVRQYLQPNAGVTIDAQVSNALMSWLSRNVPDGKLAMERDVRQGLRKTLSHFGDNALEYATRALIKHGVIWYGPIPNLRPWKGRTPHAYRLLDPTGYTGNIYK